MTEAQIAKWREVAQKATPGPWTWVVRGGASIRWIIGKVLTDGCVDTVAEVSYNTFDRDFIAIFSPSVVLELLDAAQRECEREKK